MLAGARVRQGLCAALAHGLGRLSESHRLQLGGDGERLLFGSIVRLHRVDGLEHGGDPRALRLRDLGEDAAEEVDRAALVDGVGEDLRYRADHDLRLVAGEHAHLAHAARLQPREEPPPALRGAYRLSVLVVVHADGDHRRYVLVSPAPAALKVYPVDVDVDVGPLERAVAPLLDRRERPLVQVRGGGGRDAGAPEHLAHFLDPPGGHARQVHLNHGLLDARLAAPVALDDRRGEPHPLELGHAQRDLAGLRRELPLVVPRAEGLAVGGAPLALGAHQVARLLFQQAVQSVLGGPPHKLAQIGLQALLVQCYDGLGRGLSPICFLSRQLESYRGGLCTPSYLDAIPLSKCARNCTLPRTAGMFAAW